jgi:hypothetical protein
MGKAHGETAAQDTRGLRGMPPRHSRRAHSRVTHGVVTREPVAVKAAWRVREGAAREKGQKWLLARQPTSTQKTGSRAQASRAVFREARAIWRKLNCLNPSLQKVQADTRRKDVRYRRRPLPQDSDVPVAILRGAGAMPSQGIEGDERDA